MTRVSFDTEVAVLCPTLYPDSLTLAEARAAFFVYAKLGDDGGYTARWVRIESKPIPVFFPNTACRVAAAKLHDLHHVATEYAVDWTGEAEIAAWELAGGCGRYGWAWLLNLGAFTVGLGLTPRRLFRAFVRGRSARNLYHTGLTDDELHDLTVGVLRRQLNITTANLQVHGRDIVAFVTLALGAIAWHTVVGMTIIGGCWLALRHVIGN